MPASTKQNPALATLHDDRWASVVARDRVADGSFYYAVTTTGVYCRPSCGARLARPAHVRFYATREEAAGAGFRPCKRCRPDRLLPDQRHAVIVTEACRVIEQAESAPSLEILATGVGVSPSHFHRLFKRAIGLTPREYADTCRAQRVRRTLGRSRTVTDALFDAGYQSSGRFYERSCELLGMTPAAYRAGGANATIRFALDRCSLGSVLVAQSERGICAIFLGDDPATLVRDLENRFCRARLVRGDHAFQRVVGRVVAFVDEPAHGLDLPLDVRGTVFEHRVWRALRDIPAGGTATYKEIARRIGAPKSARAVARACAANTLAVAVPCHRVVRNDGSISGYRWGVARKRRLLEMEARPRSSRSDLSRR